MKLYSIQDAIALCNTQVLTIDLILNERYMPQAYKQLNESDLLDLFDYKVSLSQYEESQTKETKYSFQQTYLVFKQDKIKDVDFYLNWHSHDKRFGYNIFTNIQYPNLSRYDKDRIEKQLGLNDLNKVIKPSRKKLIELFENALILHEAYTKENNKNLDTVNQFKAKILDAVKGLDKKDYYLNNSNTDSNLFTSGTIRKQNYEYKFNIESNGYITEKIEYVGKKDLETFLSL